MALQFKTASLLRSTAFFAAGCWAITWFWRYPDATSVAIYVIPGAFGGSIGALFGRTPRGVFTGLAVPFLLTVTFFLLIALVTLADILLYLMRELPR